HDEEEVLAEAGGQAQRRARAEHVPRRAAARARKQRGEDYRGEREDGIGIRDLAVRPKERARGEGRRRGERRPVGRGPAGEEKERRGGRGAPDERGEDGGGVAGRGREPGKAGRCDVEGVGG